MRIIAPGHKADEGSWIEKRFVCGTCSAVMEPTQADAHLIEAFNDRPDNRSTMIMACPYCLKTTLWREAPIIEPLRQFVMPEFLQKEKS